MKQRASKALKATKILAAHPSLLQRRQHLFLLSHVRGYTTLLSHILGSHPEVSGYAETWITYSSRLDLFKLRLFICNHGNYKPQSRYLFDKLLHNQLTICDAILGREDVRVIFMIRQPVPTLKSMVALYRAYIAGGGSPIGCTLPATIDAAWKQYRDRLRALTAIGERLRRLDQSSLVIAADALIDNSEDVLREVAGFLDLSTPLGEHYSLFARSGTWDRGGTSDFIHQRAILRRRPGHDDIIVPVDMAEQANEAYESCLTKLRQWSLVALHILLLWAADGLDFANAAIAAT